MAILPTIDQRLPDAIPSFFRGIRLPDNTDIQNLVNLNHSISDELVATPAATVANAAGLQAAINTFTTVASGAGCALPNNVPGTRLLIKNEGANALRVFAIGGATINGTAGATGILQTVGGYVWYVCNYGGTWSTVDSAEVNNGVVVAPNGAVLIGEDSGLTYTNEGATAIVPFVLPPASASLRFTFIVVDADGIRVTASAGDTIRAMITVSAAAGKIEGTTIGNVLELLAVNDTQWIALITQGTWYVT